MILHIAEIAHKEKLNMMRKKLNEEVGNLTTNTNTNSETNKDEQLEKVIPALFHRSKALLNIEFPQYKITGHVRQHHFLGPFLAFELIEDNNDTTYACGFMFNELLERHKDKDDAKQWLASFFIDMIDEQVNKPLPLEPKNGEEANALIQDVVLPYTLKSIREEFGETKIHVRFTQHPKAGPVLEAGFPDIPPGNKVCAIPVNLLLALYLLNRDCAEPIINGLYALQEEAHIQ